MVVTWYIVTFWHSHLHHAKHDIGVATFISISIVSVLSTQLPCPLIANEKSNPSAFDNVEMSCMIAPLIYSHSKIEPNI